MQLACLHDGYQNDLNFLPEQKLLYTYVLSRLRATSNGHKIKIFTLVALAPFAIYYQDINDFYDFCLDVVTQWEAIF